jgi:tetratricopeptide (TPR) repeat protein
VDAFFQKGLSLAKKGRWKEALAAYRESLRTNPDNPQTHLNMGFVYYEMGYDQDAQQAFDRAKKLQARACRAR